jgi:hypothetical protein
MNKTRYDLLMVVLHECLLLQNQRRDKILDQCLLSTVLDSVHPLSPMDDAETKEIKVCVNGTMYHLYSGSVYSNAYLDVVQRYSGIRVFVQ